LNVSLAFAVAEQTRLHVEFFFTNCQMLRRDCRTSTIYLFVIKGHRPLTYHISSITITTQNAQAIKMKKLTMQIIKPRRTSISC